EAADRFPAGRCLTTGNPVRAAFAGQAPPYPPSSGGPLRVLVFGGSRGARTLNRAAAEAAATWAGRAGLELLIQTGPADHAGTEAAFTAAGADPQRVRVVPYIDDMASALAAADLVVCRAGAMTLAELQAAGRPAVLVPFPFATDDHQRRNAESCAAAGAAEVLLDADCDGPALVKTVDVLLGNRDRLMAMARAARGLARPDAARAIARDLLTIVGRPAGTTAPTP
ncbi:MAG TPA: glycosyltransferase, partial [Candidatus Krumholzibacteria bacterium]|nr:glycosyltransferase [Candidatus Krumholzibacteria bacterium]